MGVIVQAGNYVSYENSYGQLVQGRVIIVTEDEYAVVTEEGKVIWLPQRETW